MEKGLPKMTSATQHFDDVWQVKQSTTTFSRLIQRMKCSSNCCVSWPLSASTLE